MGEKSNALAISYHKWMNQDNFESKLLKLTFLLFYLMNWTCNKTCFLPSQNGLKAQILLLHVHGIGLKPIFYYTRWVQSPNIYILRSGLTHVPLSPLIGLKPISCSSINQGSWPSFFLSYLKKWTSTIRTHIYTKFKGKMPNHSC